MSELTIVNLTYIAFIVMLVVMAIRIVRRFKKEIGTLESTVNVYDLRRRESENNAEALRKELWIITKENKELKTKITNMESSTNSRTAESDYLTKSSSYESIDQLSLHNDYTYRVLHDKIDSIENGLVSLIDTLNNFTIPFK